jgi:hypothetical protein
MLGPASSLQTTVDLPVADRLVLRPRVAVPWRVVVVAVLSLLVMLVLVPASASAEPLCTDTWTGPAEGNWTTAEDWSSGVPTSSSVVCIAAGKTVKVTEGVHQAGVIEDKGGLWVYFGTLEVTNALEASSVAGLTMQGATLTEARA